MKLAARAPAGSLLFGILALLGFPFSPPHFGHFANPLFPVVMTFIGLGLVLGLIGVVGASTRGARRAAITGILCSIASPLLALALKPRGDPRNESGTLGDIRTIVSAQAAYQSANAGYYDRLECLAAPRACLPSYPETAPTFLDSYLASGFNKSGYRRHFIAGSRAPQGLTASSMSSYAYIAVPIVPGETGVRGFCADGQGVICTTSDGSMPFVRDGRCVSTIQDRNSDCRPLQ